MLQNKYLNLKEEHLEKALTELICHNQNFDLRLQNEQKSCAFYSTENIELDLLELLPFGGKVWKCVGAISNTGESFFRVKSKWIMLKDGKEHELAEDFLPIDCSIAFYDQENVEQTIQNEKFSYIGKELTKIRENTKGISPN